MELWEISILIIIVGCISLIAIRMFRAPQLVKQQQKASKELTLTSAMADEKKVYKDTIESLKKHNRSLQNTVNKIRGLEGDEEITEDEDVPPEILKIAAAKLGLNAEALNEPRTIKWIQEQLRSPEAKEMILEYIKGAKSQSTDPYAGIAEV